MESRRPVKTRQVLFFQKLAQKLVQIGLTPNQISVASVLFAMIAAFLMWKDVFSFSINAILFILCIQLRLICNLIDGLMAVEGGLKTTAGEIYNDVPDRISDAFFFVGASLAIPSSWGLTSGWLLTVLAIMTAYVRVLGASLGKGHDFSGPMAKQHRMFLLSLTLLLAIFEEALFSQRIFSMNVGYAVLILGTFWTILSRLKRLKQKLL